MGGNVRSASNPTVAWHAEAHSMVSRSGIAPIFHVHDLDAAMRHDQRLGISARAYEGGSHGVATRSGMEIHLGHVPDGHAPKSRRTCGLKTPMSWRQPGVRAG
jgi:hypothetical protein